MKLCPFVKNVGDVDVYKRDIKSIDNKVVWILKREHKPNIIKNITKIMIRFVYKQYQFLCK